MAKLYASNKDESARLFKSDFLEMFTHVHWSVPIILFGPVVTYLLYRATLEHAITLGTGVSLFIAGLFVWTLTEYLLHRFVFHYEPRSEWGRKLHFMMHGVHHDYPNDSKRLVMPPSVSIPLALLFYGLFLLILGPVYVYPFFAAFLVGYMCYDTLHYATHHSRMRGAALQWLKHHHIRHHYQEPNKGYGVSSPLWDFVFGTIDKEEAKAAVEN